ncbi:palmitoyltransferase ZDHHC5-like isoform X2 [Narcine bancroftii]|uniref:palmitoyltransferase ZDHHC5-like isoform X2 n=1 Tax=Narcine bancroftii TaxID=1343680 RepID=UPI0038321144
MPLGSRKEFNPSKYIPVLAATTFLVGSTSLFFVFPCPWLSQTFTPVVPVYNVIIFLFVLANFCKATFMDPGIYPRADEDEDKDEDLRAPLFKNVEIRGIQVRMKWCSTCRFYRPPRCSHCSVCDNCVEEFDHHCPWVNNCIGRRNYRYFFLFLISLTTHIVGIFFFALVYLLHHLDRISSVHSAVTVAVMCVAGLFFIPVAGLTAFHLVLVARGRTTNEQVTGKFRGGVNPFTQGCWRNTSYMLCSSQSPRYLSQEKREYPIPLETPFVRPAISDAELRCSLTIMESQSADAEPPPPPKPNLARFSGLRTHLTLATGEGSSLIHHSDNPPTPTMYKFRPAYVDVGQNHFELRHPYSESISPDSFPHSQSYRSETSPGTESDLPPSPSLYSSALPDPSPPSGSPLSSRGACPLPSDDGATTSTSYKSLANAPGSPPTLSDSPGSETAPARAPARSPARCSAVPAHGRTLISPGDEVRTQPNGRHWLAGKAEGRPTSPPPLTAGLSGSGRGVKKVSGVGGTTYEISV